MGKNERPYTEDQKRQMASIYQSTTAGLRSLTARFGGSLASAAAAVRGQGVQLREGGPRRGYEARHLATQPTKARISDAAAQVSGETAAAIIRQWTGGAKDLRGLGRIHGMSSRTVREVLAVAGLL